MGTLCSLVFQPVIQLIQVVVAVLEQVLVFICQLIEEVVSVVEQVLQYVCNTVVQTVCGAVCSVVCGICDFFCGIFGCDCGCENVCNNVCNTVTQVVCGWTYVLQSVLELVTQLVCNYIVQWLIKLINLVEAIVTMVLTWVCSIIDVIIHWFLCWSYIAEGIDALSGRDKPHSFRVSPKLVRNAAGYSDWFVYVNNGDKAGSVDQTPLYILSDEGRPLLPVRNRGSGEIEYVEVVTRGNVITGALRRSENGFVTGRPFLYVANKIIEIASHLLGDVFTSDPKDDGSGTDFHRNHFTYLANVQAWLEADKKKKTNNYNNWNGKFTDPTSSDFFGDGSIPDAGIRVDVDGCSKLTNTFLHLVNGGIEFTPPDTDIAEDMTCGVGQSLNFDETNYLMLNKGDSTSVTTYFVSRYSQDDTADVGCNDLLGYTIVTFSDQFGASRVLPFEADTNRMMSLIVENISGDAASVVRVAETYLHECGHQCGLLHETDNLDCENDQTLHIAKLMNPGGEVRRGLTRFEWCMIRDAVYTTTSELEAFTKAPELPDSGSTPGGTP